MRNLRIYLPMGVSRDFWAYWLGLMALEETPDVMHLALQIGEAEHVLFSPRVAVQDIGAETLIYHPAMVYDYLTYDDKVWVAEHPEWPRILELKVDESGWQQPA